MNLPICKVAASICLLVLALSTFPGCQRKSSGWTGTIERRGLTVVVKNPRTPLYGPEIFRLEKDLTIGKAEGEKEYILSSIGGIAVDSENRIYIIDRDDANVRVFEANGNYSRTIGQKGQGPGETQMPVFIQITSENELAIYDYMSAHAVYYSLDGRFLRQVPTGHPLQPVELDSQGNLVGFEILAPPPPGGKVLKRYGPNFSFLADVAQEEPGKMRAFEIGRPALYASMIPDFYVVWGYSERYLLHVLNESGDLIRTIEREYSPVRILPEDREGYRKKYADAVRAGFTIEFRDYFPAFRGIFADDGGRIFVKTYEREEGKADLYCYDVFDPEGRYETRIPLTVDLSSGSVWRNHKLYVIESDAQGFQMVNRYAVSWKK